MIHETLEHISEELAGLPDVSSVRIGVPCEPELEDAADNIEGEPLTLFITFLNIEHLDRRRGQAKIRVMLTAYYPDNKARDEDTQTAALEALDHAIEYLSDRQGEYTLIATPDHVANNIWSSLRMGLRPFLVYECTTNMPQ